MTRALASTKTCTTRFAHQVFGAVAGELAHLNFLLCILFIFSFTLILFLNFDFFYLFFLFFFSLAIDLDLSVCKVDVLLEGI